MIEYRDSIIKIINKKIKKIEKEKKITKGIEFFRKTSFLESKIEVLEEIKEDILKIKIGE